MPPAVRRDAELLLPPGGLKARVESSEAIEAIGRQGPKRHTVTALLGIGLARLTGQFHLEASPA